MANSAQPQTLQSALRHCDDAERAADESRWQAAEENITSVQTILLQLAQAHSPTGFRRCDVAALNALNQRIKQLLARASAAREDAAKALCGMRKQRSAVDAYRRYG